ncbi:MAG: hypothetical protein ACLT98_14440 [Eggerthellaceae bacterium]
MTGYRAFNAVFAKTCPCSRPASRSRPSCPSRRGQALAHRRVPIDYRDRPEGSESKLNTFSGSVKVLAMIMSLFRTRAVQLARASVLLAGPHRRHPRHLEFAATGLVPRLPSALLAVALVFVGILAFASGSSWTRWSGHSQVRLQVAQATSLWQAQGVAKRLEGAGVDNTRYALHHTAPLPVNHPSKCLEQCSVVIYDLFAERIIF